MLYNEITFIEALKNRDQMVADIKALDPRYRNFNNAGCRDEMYVIFQILAENMGRTLFLKPNIEIFIPHKSRLVNYMTVTEKNINTLKNKGEIKNTDIIRLGIKKNKDK